MTGRLTVSLGLPRINDDIKFMIIVLLNDQFFSTLMCKPQVPGVYKYVAKRPGDFLGDFLKHDA